MVLDDYRIELADSSEYNHCRSEILRFLYEKKGSVKKVSNAQGKPLDEEASSEGTQGSSLSHSNSTTRPVRLIVND